MKKLVWAFWLLNMLDILTTMIGLTYPNVVETNRMMLWLLNHGGVGAFISVKVLMATALAFLASHIIDTRLVIKTLKWYIIYTLLVSVVGVYIMTVINNIMVIHRASML